MSVFKPTWKRNGVASNSRIWWMDATVDGTRVRKSLGVADKRAALIKEAQIIRRLELRSAGLETHGDCADAKPETIVAEYECELIRRRSSAEHVRRTTTRIRALLEGATSLSEVTPGFVRAALARAQASPIREHLDSLSARTLNAYRVALNGLFNWLIQEERWTSNPVQRVKPIKETGSKRERRALDDDELRALVDCADPSRVLCYVVAVTTGLRRSELAALRWADVDLKRATIRVRASTAKNRKDAWQPIAAGTLRRLNESERIGDAVFTCVPTTKQLRTDLEAAEVPYETAHGVADFHALRVTYATRLAKAGVSLVQAQKLMRHSDPKLTANIYTRLRLDDARAAVAKIDVD